MAAAAEAQGRGPQLGGPPKSKEEVLKTFLRKGAVSDADHDFSGERAGGALFSTIFRGKGGLPPYKDIGTPKTLKAEEDTISSEADILSYFLGYRNGGDEVAEFKQKFLHDGQTIGHFYRFAEDETPFVVTSMLCAKKNAAGDYVWNGTSTDLYNFMNPHGQDAIAFTVDALKFPFYEMLQADRIKAGEKQKKAFYLISRETLNDAAGKVVIEPPKKGSPPVVSIETRTDAAPYSILYPLVDEKRKLAELADIELFFSNYSLSLTPISTANGLTSTTLSFHDKQLIRQVQVLKSSKEDAHPNSVPALATRIRGLLKYLGKAGNTKEKVEYHTFLQQKRSGDWLQIQAGLCPQRFGLPENIRIGQITIDKICVAYGILMGQDQFLIYYDDATGEYWMIRIAKDLKKDTRSAEEKFIESLKYFPEPTDKVAGLDLDYNAARAVYEKNWNGIHATLLKAMKDALEELKTPPAGARARFQKSDFEGKLRVALEAATTLAVFRTLAPEIVIPVVEGEEEAPEKESDVYLNDDEYILETRQAYFELYQSNYAAVKKALSAKGARAAGAGEAIGLFFNGIFLKKNGPGTVAQKQREELIKRLSVFGTLFSRENSGTNGIGIFSYLNTALSAAEKGAVEAAMTAAVEQMPAGGDRKKYETFLKVMDTTLGVPREVPTAAELKTSDLLEALDGVNAGVAVPPPVEEVGAAELAGAEDKPEEEKAEAAVEEAAGAAVAEAVEATDAALQVSNTLHATDFTAALGLIALRAQKDLAKGEAEILKGVLEQFAKWARGEALQGGGGTGSRGSRAATTRKGPEFFHNPLVTWYLLLRELAFRIKTVEDSVMRGYYIRLSKLLLRAIHEFNGYLSKVIDKLKEYQIKRETEEHIEYLYYSYLEAYLLELAEDDEVMTALVPGYVIREVMGDLKRNYYGITAVANAEERAKMNRADIHAVLRQEEGAETTPEAQVEENLSYMARIIEMVDDMERTLFEVPVVTLKKTSKTLKRIMSAQKGAFTGVTYKKGKGSKAPAGLTMAAETKTKGLTRRRGRVAGAQTKGKGAATLRVTGRFID